MEAGIVSMTFNLHQDCINFRSMHVRYFDPLIIFTNEYTAFCVFTLLSITNGEQGMKHPLACTSRPPMLQSFVICVESDASCDSAACGRTVKLLVTKKADAKFLPISTFRVVPFRGNIGVGNNDRIKKAKPVMLRMADQLSYLGV